MSTGEIILNISKFRAVAALFGGACAVMVIGGAARYEKLPAPAATCFEVAGKGPTYNVLIVGESWASGAKEMPDLPLAASKRLNGREVRACSIGFSGRNSGQILALLKSQYPETEIRALFDGQNINNVVILTGVNDALQHVGQSAYARGVTRLADYFKADGTVQVVNVPRINQQFSGPVTRIAKRWTQDIIHDGGQRDVVDRYRQELTAKSPSIATIDYDQFAGRYEANKKLFKQDGIHLTEAEFHQYGTFLANHMILKSTMPSNGKIKDST